MIKFLTWNHYPRLPWRVPNSIISILTRQRQREMPHGREKGNVITETEPGVTGPQVRDLQQPPEGRSG